MVARFVTPERDPRGLPLRARRPFESPWPTPRVPPDCRFTAQDKRRLLAVEGQWPVCPVLPRLDGRWHPGTEPRSKVPGCKFIAGRSGGCGVSRESHG